MPSSSPARADTENVD